MNFKMRLKFPSKNHVSLIYPARIIYHISQGSLYLLLSWTTKPVFELFETVTVSVCAVGQCGTSSHQKLAWKRSSSYIDSTIWWRIGISNSLIFIADLFQNWWINVNVLNYGACKPSPWILTLSAPTFNYSLPEPLNCQYTKQQLHSLPTSEANRLLWLSICWIEQHWSPAKLQTGSEA